MLSSKFKYVIYTGSLKQQLGIGGRKVRVLIETMAAIYILETSIVCNLTTSNFEGSIYIKLVNVYTEERLPLTKRRIKTQCDVDAWDQLEDKVLLKQIGADIRMLLMLTLHWQW